jgi:hypothetical protein
MFGGSHSTSSCSMRASQPRAARSAISSINPACARPISNLDTRRLSTFLGRRLTISTISALGFSSMISTTRRCGEDSAGGNRVHLSGGLSTAGVGGAGRGLAGPNGSGGTRRHQATAAHSRDPAQRAHARGNGRPGDGIRSRPRFERRKPFLDARKSRFDCGDALVRLFEKVRRPAGDRHSQRAVLVGGGPGVPLHVTFCLAVGQKPRREALCPSAAPAPRQAGPPSRRPIRPKRAAISRLFAPKREA